MNNDRENKSPHILNTSATLLGLCFVVLTSLQVLKLKEASLIDEFTATAIFLFMTSSMLSFLSLRSKTDRSEVYENIASGLFLAGLITMFITATLLVFGIIR